jgi:hypothetical protein
MPNHRLCYSPAFSGFMRIRELVAALSILVATCAHSQTWNYQSYYDGEGVTYPLDVPLYPGYITLDESGEQPIFTMLVGRTTKCFSGPIVPKVERTRDTTMIVVRRDLKGCRSARFVIKNDGTGGHREVLRDGKWAWDGLEHGLTLRK